MANIEKFDEIQCQVLKVSGANKLESTKDVTSYVRALDATTATKLGLVDAMDTNMLTMMATDYSGQLTDIGGMTEAATTALATISDAQFTDLAAISEAILTVLAGVTAGSIEDLGDMAEADTTALATVKANAFTQLAAMPAGITLAKAAGSTNEVKITVTVQDQDGSDMAEVFNLMVWTSDASSGAGVSSSLDPDSLAPDTGKGASLLTLTANKNYIMQSPATGDLVVVLTDAATGGGYFCVMNPVTGQTSTILIEAGDYGT